MSSFKLTRFTLLFVFLVFGACFAPVAKAYDTVKSITVTGNQRVEKETVLSHLGLSPGEKINDETLDKALKSLFDSGLFMDAHLKVDRGGLIVSVVENPIVNQVELEGNDEISDEILKGELTLRPRQVYTLSRVKADTKRLQDIYRVKGHFSAIVTPKIIKRHQNRVDVIFEIKEGEKTSVRDIFFVGNKKYGNSKLESVIQTKEHRWYRFFNNDDNYDPDRLAYDRELLRKFYLEHGYADFLVKSAVAELTPDKKEFFITFTLQEGERYKFGALDVVSSLPDVNAESFRQYLKMSEGDWYSTIAVERTSIRMTDALGNQGYAFVDVKPKVKKDQEKKTISITFDIQEGPKVYIDRITVTGNDRTDEEVIRRELRFYEGDAYNTTNQKISEQRLKNLGYFKKVTLRREPSTSPDKVNIVIEVEEEPTGELSLGGGYSTADGPLANVSFSESNFRGKGQSLSVGLTFAKRRQEFNIGFTEPYFLDRDISAGFDLYRTRQNKFYDATFDQKTIGLRLRAGYGLSDYWSQGWSYTIQREDINGIENNASRFIFEQKGASTLSALGHNIMYDRRDSRINPTDGYFVGLGNEFAGLGGNVRYLRNKLSAGYYYLIYDDVVLAVSGSYGHMLEVGKKIRIVDRFTLGGDTFRGFEVSGIGPRDTRTNDALGGRQFYSGTAEVTFPMGLPEEFAVKGATFIDAGSVWSSGDSGPEVYDTPKFRATAGFGFRWRSPMGPIKIDFAWPIVKDKRDKTQPFLFGFSTRF